MLSDSSHTAADGSVCRLIVLCISPLHQYGVVRQNIFTQFYTGNGLYNDLFSMLCYHTYKKN